MNINGLGNTLPVGAKAKAAKENKYEENLFFNRFSQQAKEKGRDSFRMSGEDAVASIMGNYEYYSIQTINRITETGKIDMSAVVETTIRNISYQESDHIQVNVAQGYTYRAKVDVSGHCVYMEYRDDEGTTRAYVADVPSIAKDTENPVEQMALASWNKVMDENRRALGFTEYKQPILAGEKVPGKYVNGCFVSEMTTYEDTIYVGKFGDACGMASMFGGSWSDYYPMKEGDGHPESLEVTLFTGRTVIIDIEQISQISKLKGVLSQAEYAQLMQAISEEDGSIRMPQEKWDELLKRTDSQIDAFKQWTKENIEQRDEDAEEVKLYNKRNAPYSQLADDNGVIVYNGVTFVCDFEKNAICLGDVSDLAQTLIVPLAGGGCLKVNRDNLDDLARAIGMFSAEDRGRIMRAIATDAKIQKMRREIEDEESKIGEEISGDDAAQGDGKEEESSLR